VYRSRQSGKDFYESRRLPGLLKSYVSQSGLRTTEQARNFGMSAKTLDSIMSGGTLSENMLFRIQNALERDERGVNIAARGISFPGDWRSTTSSDVQAAIAIVSEKLVFLKRIIQSSNYLSSKESPIDPIQVAQLTALLGAMIEALGAPIVDRKQAKGFFRWLSGIAKKAFEKGLESQVTNAMDGAVDAGTDLIRELAKQPGASDLGSSMM